MSSMPKDGKRAMGRVGYPRGLLSTSLPHLLPQPSFKTAAAHGHPEHSLSSITLPMAASGGTWDSGAEQRKQPFSLRLRVADTVLAELGRTPDMVAMRGGAEGVSASGGWTWSQK